MADFINTEEIKAWTCTLQICPYYFVLFSNLLTVILIKPCENSSVKYLSVCLWNQPKRSSKHWYKCVIVLCHDCHIRGRDDGGVESRQGCGASDRSTSSTRQDTFEETSRRSLAVFVPTDAKTSCYLYHNQVVSVPKPNRRISTIVTR